MSYKNNKKVGVATIIITGEGDYCESISQTFVINPKGTSLSSVKAVGNIITAKWKKQATQTTGYRIQYATDAAFTKNVVTANVTSTGTLSKTIDNLKKSKTYYFRIRTYKTLDGKKYYSAWSKAKSVKTTKDAGLVLSASEGTVYTGKTLKLKAYTAPSGKTVKWKSSNKKLATVSSKGVVKGVKKGNVTITATYTYKGKKYTKKCKVKVYKTKSKKLKVKTKFIVREGQSGKVTQLYVENKGDYPVVIDSFALVYPYSGASYSRAFLNNSMYSRDVELSPGYYTTLNYYCEETRGFGSGACIATTLTTAGKSYSCIFYTDGSQFISAN